MTKLVISPDLSLPLDAVTQRHAFLGKPGSGKSYAATKLAELMYDAGAQFIALDPVGIWYGLRLDGKGKGLPVPVFGGLHGDVPLTPTSGAMIADLVVDRRLSCVLDTSQFEHDTEKARFAAGFANRFFFRMKAAPAAVHLFFEECQEYMPQNPQRGEEQMLHDFTRIDKLGRNFGIGVSLISQRPQEVNKKVLNLTECLFAFQMTGAHERKAIKEWIASVGADENILTVLPTLKVAHAHVYSPQWLRISKEVMVGEKRTADVSSTPAVGVSKVAEKPLTPVDIRGLRQEMAETIEKAKASDPKELRAEIARLNAELKKAPTKTAGKSVVDQRAIDRAVTAAVKVEHGRYARLLQRVHKSLDTIGVAQENIAVAAKMVRDTVFEIGEERLTEKGGETPAADYEVVRVPTKAGGEVAWKVPRPVAPRSTVSHEGVTGVEQRILNTLAGMEALGVEQPDKATVAALNGYSNLRSKSFMNAMSSLRTAGRIEYPNTDRMALTDAGRAIAENSLPVNSHDELHRLWYGLLGGVAERILTPLVEAYPDALDVDAVAATAGYENARSKSFANTKGRLRTLGLIDYPGSGRIAATKILFPEGLR